MNAKRYINVTLLPISKLVNINITEEQWKKCKKLMLDKDLRYFHQLMDYLLILSNQYEHQNGNGCEICPVIRGKDADKILDEVLHPRPMTVADKEFLSSCSKTYKENKECIEDD